MTNKALELTPDVTLNTVWNQRRKGGRLIALLWSSAALATAGFVYLSVVSARGTIVPDAELDLPTPFHRVVEDLGAEGTLVVEYSTEDSYLVVRHVTASDEARASAWAGDCKFILEDVLLRRNGALSLLLFGEGQKVTPAAIVPISLPFDALEVLPFAARDLDAPTRAGGLCPEKSRTSPPELMDVFQVAQYSALALAIGDERSQGHPRDCRSETRVDSVVEIQLNRLMDSDPLATRRRVESVGLIVAKGDVLVDRSAHVSIELGQFDVPELPLDATLLVDGGEFESVPASIEFERALPITSRSESTRYIAHVTIALPAGAKSFQLKLVTRFQSFLSPVQAWYFVASDFGQQAQLFGGYSATVLWNTPIIKGSEMPLPKFDGTLRRVWLDAAPAWIGRELPRDLGSESWSGFEVRADAPHTSATLLYKVQ